MAKKEEEKREETKPDALAGALGAGLKSAPVDDDDDDFTELSLRGDFLYVKPEPGHVIKGKLLGRYKRLGKSKGSGMYYRVKLTKPCIVFKGNKANLESFEAPTGSVVCVDERESIKPLLDLSTRAEKGEEIEVKIKCLEKRKSGNDMEFWAYDIGYKIHESDIEFPSA